MPSLPTGLIPTVAAYSYGGPGGVQRTDVAGGAPRYALQWDRGVQQFNVTLILGSVAFGIWTAFFHHIIKKGALTFDMPLDSGFGTEPHACNIVPGSYTATRTEGVAMIVAFVVEAESKAYDFTAADAQSMIDVYNQYGDGSSLLLARIARFANLDTLVLS